MWWADLEGKLNATDIQIVTQKNVVDHLKLDMKGTQTHVEITVLVRAHGELTDGHIYNV